MPTSLDTGQQAAKHFFALHFFNRTGGDAWVAAYAFLDGLAGQGCVEQPVHACVFGNQNPVVPLV